jgi:hypothetical protein
MGTDPLTAMYRNNDIGRDCGLYPVKIEKLIKSPHDTRVGLEHRQNLFWSREWKILEN